MKSSAQKTTFGEGAKRVFRKVFQQSCPLTGLCALLRTTCSRSSRVFLYLSHDCAVLQGIYLNGAGKRVKSICVSAVEPSESAKKSIAKRSLMCIKRTNSYYICLSTSVPVMT